MKWSSHSGLVLVCVTLLALGGYSSAGEFKNPVSQVVVSIPDVNGKFGGRLRSTDETGEVAACIDCNPPRPLYVLLTNVGQKPLKLWDGVCSRGYYSVEFEIVGSDGKTRSLRRRHIDFSSKWRMKPANDLSAEDILMWFVVQPGESVVWCVELDSSDWQDLSWIPTNKELKAKVRAIYSVVADSAANGRGVWTGRAESKWYDFSIYRSARTKHP